MYDDKTKEKLKSYLPDYLERYHQQDGGTGRNGKDNIKCLYKENHKNGDEHPSAKFFPGSNTVYCWTCGKLIDLFHYIERDFNINNFPDEVKKAADLFNVDITAEAGPGEINNRRTEINGPGSDLIKAIRTANKRALESPEALAHFKARGFSESDVKKYYLGYDPDGYNSFFKDLPDVKTKSYKAKYYKYFYPNASFNYVIAEISDRKQEDEYNQKYKLMKNTPKPLYFYTADKNIKSWIITEGQIDAMTLNKQGYNTISTNGGNSGALKTYAANHKDNYFLLAMDNDKTGKKSINDYMQIFKAENLEAYAPDPAELYSGLKDANEAYTAGKINKTVEILNRYINNRIRTLPQGTKQPTNDENGQPYKEHEKNKKTAEIANKGLITYDKAIEMLQNANDKFLTFKGFPVFSKAAKIQTHDYVIIAAETGAGKSALAINLLNSLMEKYECIYLNLEMDNLTLLRRLIAIKSGQLTLSKVYKYKQEPKVKTEIESTLKELERAQPLRFINDVYSVDDLNSLIQTLTAGKTEPTVIFIDHALLLETPNRTGGNYERATYISEKLRKIALANNIILIALTQQNRAGKADQKAPELHSLKGSGSFENDATHVVFIWTDPDSERSYLMIKKNRNGESGKEIEINFYKPAQIIQEEPDQPDQDEQRKEPVQEYLI